MQTIQILDIKSFMQLLFNTDTFDDYDFVSADLRTDMTYHLDGHFNKDFYSQEELELLHKEHALYLSWQTAKEKIFYLIKGKKTPSVMKVVLKPSDESTPALLKMTGTQLSPSDISGVFLNILFQENALSLVCGVSYNIFTMDKSFENDFTSYIVSRLQAASVTCQTI